MAGWAQGGTEGIMDSRMAHGVAGWAPGGGRVGTRWLCSVAMGMHSLPSSPARSKEAIAMGVLARPGGAAGAAVTLGTPGGSGWMKAGGEGAGFPWRD